MNHVTGCTSYQDIRTLPDGTICDTFKEAAFQRGLLEDDRENDLILEEGAQHSIPPQIRQLFVIILLNNSPNNPRALWNKHKYSFSEGFPFRARKSNHDIQFDEHILNSALVDIENRF